MSDYKSNKKGEATAQLIQARETVESKFKSSLESGDNAQGFWYDWVFADILIREAETLIEGRPPIAAPSAPN